MPLKYKRAMANIAFYTVAVLLICLLLPRLIVFFMPFVIGWIIAMIANPLVRLLEKRLKLRRRHGSALMIIVVIAAVVAAIYLLASWVISWLYNFISDLPELYRAFEQSMETAGAGLEGIFSRLPPDITEGIADVFDSLMDSLSGVVGSIGVPTLSAAGSIAKNIPNMLVMTIFTILSAYFFIADHERILETVRAHASESATSKWHFIIDSFKRAVGGYIKAQLKIMAVIAAILFAGFLLMDISYAILWAILIAFLDFLPFLGTGTALWPWAVIKLLNGDYMYAVWLIILYLICLLMHQLLQPKLIGDSVGMNPFATLFFMFVGYRLNGVFGMIIAIPVGMIIISLKDAGAFDEIISDIRVIWDGINDYRKGKQDE